MIRAGEMLVAYFARGGRFLAGSKVSSGIKLVLLRQLFPRLFFGDQMPLIAGLMYYRGFPGRARRAGTTKTDTPPEPTSQKTLPYYTINQRVVQI